MAFPITHLFAGYEVLKCKNLSAKDEAQFLLGCIAPDAVHHIPIFEEASMKEIGPAKKVSHLCPVSDELWGKVTDNDGWVESIRAFYGKNKSSPFAAGYATHTLTDVYNNISLWERFCKNYPEEVALGYDSKYYDNLRHIDGILYQEAKHILDVLAASKAEGLTGIIEAEYVEIIKNDLLYSHFAIDEKKFSDCKKTDVRDFKFVTYEEMLDFIKRAAAFSARVVLF